MALFVQKAHSGTSLPRDIRLSENLGEEPLARIRPVFRSVSLAWVPIGFMRAQVEGVCFQRVIDEQFLEKVVNAIFYREIRPIMYRITSPTVH